MDFPTDVVSTLNSRGAPCSSIIYFLMSAFTCESGGNYVSMRVGGKEGGKEGGEEGGREGGGEGRRRGGEEGRREGGEEGRRRGGEEGRKEEQV